MNIEELTEYQLLRLMTRMLDAQRNFYNRMRDNSVSEGASESLPDFDEKLTGFCDAADAV